MKIIYVFPPLGFNGKRMSTFPIAPPALEYMAGLTAKLRPDSEIDLINANSEDVFSKLNRPDIVGIHVLTHQAPWAYALADSLRYQGIQVILGGPHPSVVPHEAKMHCDAVVVGESESVLGEVFSDFEARRLKPVYQGRALPLNALPEPKRNILSGYIFRSYFTARGCPYRCRFCSIPNIHGNKVRYRPIAEVVEELGRSKHKRWFCSDADIWGPSIKRSADLFREMSLTNPGIMWVGEASLSSAIEPGSDKMLALARKSGLSQVMVGVESFNDKSLKSYLTHKKQGPKELAAIDRIRSHGIDVILFIMMHPSETKADYAGVLDKCDELNIAAHPVMAVPYPGTDLNREFKHALANDGDWSFYDGLHSVCGDDAWQTGLEREQNLVDLWLELYSLPRIVKRLTAISISGFPNAHMSSLMVQMALRGAFRNYSKRWLSELAEAFLDSEDTRATVARK